MTKERGAYLTQAKVQRRVDMLVGAAREAGVKIGGFEVTLDGTIRVFTAGAVARSVDSPDDAYDGWKSNNDS